jgi:hypothetical protein
MISFEGPINTAVAGISNLCAGRPNGAVIPTCGELAGQYAQGKLDPGDAGYIAVLGKIWDFAVYAFYIIDWRWCMKGLTKMA